MNEAGIQQPVRGGGSPWQAGRPGIPMWIGAIVASVALSVAAILGVDALGLFSNDIVESPSTAVSSVSTTPSAVTLPEDFADLYDQVRPSVVKISAVSSEGSGVGTGVVLDKQGHVLTNYHVISGASQLDVKFSDGTTVAAKVMGTDPGDDLAVLQIDVSADILKPVTFADPNNVRVGQAVIAVGNPFELEGTLTTGVVSGVGRVLSGGDVRPLRQLIQTDTVINPGNSGGGLFNLRGELIGITNAIENPSGDRVFVGVGYAIPVSTVQRFLPDMMAGKNVTHPRLGIALQDVTPAIANALGLKVQRGVLVGQVEPNSGAARAGLRGVAGSRAGDVIVAIDGQAVADYTDLANYLDTKKAGDKVELRVIRDGNEATLTVTLDAWAQN